MCYTDILTLPPQALPWRAASSGEPDHVDCWRTTLLGTMSVCRILASVLAADASARGAVLRGDSLDAALQRVRWPLAGRKSLDVKLLMHTCCLLCIKLCIKWSGSFTTTNLLRFTFCRLLRPPPQLAAAWAERREALLHRVMAALVGGSGGSRQAAGHGATAAEVDAVPAAALTTQELPVYPAHGMCCLLRHLCRDMNSWPAFEGIRHASCESLNSSIRWLNPLQRLMHCRIG
jgi:hypothetical protein